ncbi:alpha/beta hydrolase [Spongiibacter taiwanensis]|uniref:alpha/beta fold hydrolase n=1 Tax=Spongiibacter taiwanensis TaxID=1748242 RepID=UPI00203611FE|nr:alpha/beta hydrolase [Spongiibacter taiwanensis]USA44037.1 alpha/beta hydrolase [Spongiibacter taiwanensis]
MELVGPTSHTYYSQRLRLHYVDWGNHGAPPLVLLHGGQDHCRNWDWIARELRHDWHVIAPDLRGHGDSAWSRDGYYSYDAYLCDLYQLIDQKNLAPVTMVAHSMGGTIAMRYAAIYPEKVRKLVLIEGLGMNPDIIDGAQTRSYAEKMRDWVAYRQGLSSRTPRRYTSIDEALARMQEKNTHLSDEMARHLTVHGICQNEDGSYSWKFDNYCRHLSPMDITEAQIKELIGMIQCPTLLAWGRESFMESPEDNGRFQCFQDARIIHYEKAGHWLHHDQLTAFLADLKGFI